MALEKNKNKDLEENEIIGRMCTKNSDKFKKLFSQANVQYDRFVRTSADQDHKEAVNYVWNRLLEKGYITQGKHTGYYSINEETFVVENDLIWNEKGEFYQTEAGERVQLVDELNYKFDFRPEIMDKIREWTDNGDFV